MKRFFLLFLFGVQLRVDFQIGAERLDARFRKIGLGGVGVVLEVEHQTFAPKEFLPYLALGRGGFWMDKSFADTQTGRILTGGSGRFVQECQELVKTGLHFIEGGAHSNARLRILVEHEDGLGDAVGGTQAEVVTEGAILLIRVGENGVLFFIDGALCDFQSDSSGLVLRDGQQGKQAEGKG